MPPPNTWAIVMISFYMEGLTCSWRSSMQISQLQLLLQMAMALSQ